MVKGTVYLFTRNGLGNAPEDLQRILAVTFLGLVVDSGRIPDKVHVGTVGKVTDILAALQEATHVVSL
jgi:hypothetical protein